jgi:hypothetical protein
VAQNAINRSPLLKYSPGAPIARSSHFPLQFKPVPIVTCAKFNNIRLFRTFFHTPQVTRASI